MMTVQCVSSKWVVSSCRKEVGGYYLPSYYFYCQDFFCADVFRVVLFMYIEKKERYDVLQCRNVLLRQCCHYYTLCWTRVHLIMTHTFRVTSCCWTAIMSTRTLNQISCLAGSLAPTEAGNRRSVNSKLTIARKR